MTIPQPFVLGSTRCFTIEHGALRRRSAARDIKRDERWCGAFKLPPFQRDHVWTVAQSVKFIESIWLELPIASYVVNRDDRHEKGYPCDDWLLDGQQRWTAIVDYVADRFPVFDLLYSELPIEQTRRFMSRPFPSIETRNMSKQQCREVYERLAYGGTAHS